MKEAANNSAQGDKAPRPKDVPFAPSTKPRIKNNRIREVSPIPSESEKDSPKKDAVSVENQTHI